MPTTRTRGGRETRASPRASLPTPTTAAAATAAFATYVARATDITSATATALATAATIGGYAPLPTAPDPTDGRAPLPAAPAPSHAARPEKDGRRGHREDGWNAATSNRQRTSGHERHRG